MKYLLALLIIYTTSIASELLKFDIESNLDEFELSITFDSKFSNRVISKKEPRLVTITLKGVQFEKALKKRVESQFIEEIELIPSEKELKILIKTLEQVDIIASKSADSKILKLKFKQASKSITSKEEIDYSRYYLVLSGLFLTLILLFFLKRYLQKKRLELLRGGEAKSKELSMNILYQRFIDEKNRLLLFEFDGVEYLILSGSSNTLLNKRELNSLDKEQKSLDKKVKSKREEFEELLRSKGIDPSETNITIRN